MKLNRITAVLLGAGMLAFAGVASATVTKVYTLTPGSALITPISSATDYMVSGTPTWTNDGGSGHSAAVTKNTVTVVFSGGADDNVIEAGDTVTITELDFHHLIDASVPGVATITGQMDSSTSGAVGVLNSDDEVDTWSNDLTVGELHNEMYCENIVGALCGTSGLPAHMTTTVTHQDDGGMTAPFSIDSDGSPAGAFGMEFHNGYDDICFDITIDESLGRQYYLMASDASLCHIAPIPTLPEWGAIAFGTLLMATMFATVYRRRQVLGTH